MTYDSDPPRWTDVQGEAPEILRGAFDAGRREGPSDFQMRSLALKLAVVGGGAAIAASTSVASAASVAKVSSAVGGAAMTSGSAASAVKVATMSVALLGAAATGVVMVKQHSDEAVDSPHLQTTTRIRQTPEERTPAPVAPQNDPATTPASTTIEVPATAPVSARDVSTRDVQKEEDGHRRRHRHTREATSANPARDVVAAENTDGRSARVGADERTDAVREEAIATLAPESSRPSTHEERAQRRAARREARAQREREAARTTTTAASSSVSTPASAGEIALLREARSALAARPKLAFKLTEEHRDEYPNSVFTQERDALAVEALMRSGDMDDARARAADFVRRYPSSPHAHRFRETMNIQ